MKYSLFKSVQVDVISVSEFSLLKLKKKKQELLTAIYQAKFN